jgi:hypothetical protein
MTVSRDVIIGDDLKCIDGEITSCWYLLLEFVPTHLKKLRNVWRENEWYDADMNDECN